MKEKSKLPFSIFESMPVRNVYIHVDLQHTIWARPPYVAHTIHNIHDNHQNRTTLYVLEMIDNNVPFLVFIFSK